MRSPSKWTSDASAKIFNPSNLIDQIKHTSPQLKTQSAHKPSYFSDAETASLNSSGFLEPQFAPCYQQQGFLNLASSQLSATQDPRYAGQGAKRTSDKYKTELCKNFDLYGVCKWGTNCFFAHGKNELKSKIVVNHYYKTKICKHYHKGGFCPYGSRCQYFHFKPFAINQELYDSYVKKTILKIEESKSRLDTILNKNDRVQSRLPVFQALCKGEGQKSLQEKFLDGEF